MKHKYFMLLWIVAIGGCLLCQQHSPERDFRVNEYGTILEYIGTQQTVHIPATIGGKRVGNIPASAFENKNITSLILPTISSEIYWDHACESTVAPHGGPSLGIRAFARNQIARVDFGSSCVDTYNTSNINRTLPPIKPPSECSKRVIVGGFVKDPSLRSG